MTTPPSPVRVDVRSSVMSRVASSMHRACPIIPSMLVDSMSEFMYTSVYQAISRELSC